MEFTLGELFSGPGGLSHGAMNVNFNHNNEQFNIRHGWANDFHKDSCETYKQNIDGANDDNVFFGDVKELNIDALPFIDAFAYGFPCNDFSLVGEQLGFNGKFGPLYSYGINVINRFNPHFFVAENVGGITSANEGKSFKKILHDLENSGENGYNLTINLYRSEKYGIPQTRHRIIIVGIRKDHDLLFQVPAPTTPNQENYRTSREALEIPPIPLNALNNERTRQSAKVIERLSYINPGENVWKEGLPKHLQLNVKGAKLSQIYKKLHPDKPSYTITGSGGGGTHGYHYAENRALTNRERARIQTFPDDYLFLGSKESVRKQIGMAVPPVLSKIVFESILRTFAGINYAHVEPSYAYENR
ncbi:DNA cytosine methyltransferase [Kordia sp.]|uniref:DNA cytosine methyltransferase n=1 Tax=Kordia sp. TaxID=1965332 RepID=UPI003D2A69C2